VSGCLKNLESSDTTCGALTFDTCYPAVDIVDSSLGHGTWFENTKAELTILNGTEPRAAVSFEAGIKANASQVFLSQHYWRSGILIFAGVMPYLAFNVLYDASRNEIGLKPREIAVNMPLGRIILSK
jgi:hypothetical protein